MKKKILYIVPNLCTLSGVSQTILNFYPMLLKSFDIDFYVLKKFKDTIDDKLVDSNIFMSNNFQNGNNYFKEKSDFDLFIKNQHYDIVELHAPIFSFIYMPVLKKNKIPVRIIHTHSSASSNNLLKRIMSFGLNFNMMKYANVYFSCSETSARYWFKKNVFSNPFYYTIYNCVDKTDKDLNKIKEFKNQYGIKENELLYGFIGRMSKEKNLKFLIDIIETINIDNCKFLFVGDGNNAKEIREYVFKHGNKVIFNGIRNYVHKIISAFDLIFMPSIKEGLPMVAIEAQVNGINCFLSDNITKEVDIGAAKFLKLDKDLWINEIYNFKKEKQNIDLKKFSTIDCSKRLIDIYNELLKRLEW